MKKLDAAWWEDFKARHGLTPERIAKLTGQAMPTPKADAPPPPKPHTEPDDERRSEEER
jgi:hypothetical protein